MKKHITRRHITIGIYSLLLVFVLGIWTFEFIEFDNFLKKFYNRNNRLKLENVFYGLKITNIFTASVISMVLGIGVFLRNKTGWILITGWFYFCIANGFRTLLQDCIQDVSDFFAILFVFFTPISMIFLMNKFIGISEYHKINNNNNNRLILNLLAIGIGVFLAVFRILKKDMLQQYL